MKVQDILRNKGTELITITPRQTLLDASRLLSEHNIGVLLVVDGEDNPVGILSERDIVHRLARLGPDCAKTAVQEAMSEDLIVGVPDNDLDYVMSVMTNARIRHLPIIDDAKLVGLISIGDVVKAQVNKAEAEIRYLHSYITGTPTG